LSRIVGDAFLLMEFQEAGGAPELALLLMEPVGLDFAELVDGLLELPSEAGRVQAESGDGAVSVDDIEIDTGLFVGWVGGAIEEGSFERWDAVESPGGVGEFLDELGLGGSGWLVLVEELAAVELVGGEVLGGGNGALGLGV